MSSQRIRRLAGTSLLVAAVVGVGVAALVALRSNSPSGSAPRIALIGDSIVAENQSAMADHFDARELGVLIDAQSGRNLVNSFDYEGRTIRSGVTAVAELRATGFEPDLWVIELGTNDLAFMRDCDCDDPVAFAGSRIDQLLSELPWDADVLWVNVYQRGSDPAAEQFNQALQARGLRQVDWRSAAFGNDDWLIDDVHPSALGTAALADLLADAMETRIGPSA